MASLIFSPVLMAVWPTYPATRPDDQPPRGWPFSRIPGLINFGYNSRNSGLSRTRISREHRMQREFIQYIFTGFLIESNELNHFVHFILNSFQAGERIEFGQTFKQQIIKALVGRRATLSACSAISCPIRTKCYPPSSNASPHLNEVVATRLSRKTTSMV